MRRVILRVLLAAALAACRSDSPTGVPAAAEPSQLSMATEPGAAAQNGSPLSPQPAVRLRDDAGRPVARAGIAVSAALTTGGATLSGATATTDGSGIATFGSLTITGTVGSYAIRFSAVNLAPAEARAVTLNPGPPTSVAVAVEPSDSARAGTALARQPQVQLRDQSGNAASVAGIVVTASLVSGAATLTGATSTTNAAGLAVFSGLALSGATGSYALRFAAPGLGTADAAAPLVLTAGAPTQLSLATQPSASVPNGLTLPQQPVVQLRDAFGNAAGRSGDTVNAAIVTGQGSLTGTTRVVTDASGQAAFTDLNITGTAGSFTLRFTATSLASVVSSPISVSPGAARSLLVTAQPPATATNGVAMSPAPVVRVVDTTGNNVASGGVSVTASVLGGGGPALSNATVTTDAAGAATFAALTATGTAGAYRLLVSASGLAADTSAPFVLAPGSATQLVVATQPATAAQNAAPLLPQPGVQLRDQSGNAVPQAGVAVTASLVGGSAALTGGTATTSATGLATFSGLTIVGTVGSHALRFTATGLGSVDAAQPTVLAAGVAKQVGITTQPSGAAQSGVALATQPVVQLRDTSGNAVSQANVTVTASVAGGGVALANATAVTGQNGSASYSGLTISGAVGDYTLSFTAPGLAAAAAAAPTSLAAGPPAAIVIVTPPPATATSGVALAAPPVVEVRDAAGNPVTGVGVAAHAGGLVTLTGAATTTGPNGRATFSGLTLTGLAAGYSLQFCVGSSCPSASIITVSPTPTSLLPGAPATVTLTVPPSGTAQSGTPIPQQPEALVRDASGNPVPGVAVSVAAAGAAVSGGSATTDQGGAAVFSGLTLSGPPANYQLAFAAGSAATSVGIALGAGAPATMTVVTEPPSAAANGIAFGAAPEVRVLDGTGNGVPGVTVAATTSAGASVFNGAAVTDGTGLAVFTGIGLAGTSGSYSLTFTAGSATATSTSVSLGAGPAAQIAISTEPPASAQSGVPLTQVPVVKVTDGSLNGVAGAIVTATVSPAGPALTNASVLTDASGNATFTGLTIAGTAGSYTLQFATAGLPPATAAAQTGLLAGPAAKLVILTAPSTQAQNGVQLTTQPAVRVVDAGGNIVSQPGITVTAAVVGGGAAVSGATALTDGSGAAAFGSLTMTGTVGTYSLRFTASGLDSVTAAPTTLSPGVPAALSLATQPAFSGILGQPLTRQPVVQVRDVSGNAVPQSGFLVTVASNRAGTVFTGGSTATTNLNGVAAFVDLGIGSPRDGHVLSFSAPTLTPAVASDSTEVAVVLVENVPATDTGTFDAERHYVFTVQPGDTLLEVTIGGGTGTADLYVRYGQVPDPRAGLFDCFPNLGGSNEQCLIPNPAPGPWYITLVGFPFSFSGVVVTARTLP